MMDIRGGESANPDGAPRTSGGITGGDRACTRTHDSGTRTSPCGPWWCRRSSGRRSPPGGRAARTPVRRRPPRAAPARPLSLSRAETLKDDEEQEFTPAVPGMSRRKEAGSTPRYKLRTALPPDRGKPEADNLQPLAIRTTRDEVREYNHGTPGRSDVPSGPSRRRGGAILWSSLRH